jgi:hypothetical protein
MLTLPKSGHWMVAVTLEFTGYCDQRNGYQWFRVGGGISYERQFGCYDRHPDSGGNMTVHYSGVWHGTYGAGTTIQIHAENWGFQGNYTAYCQAQFAPSAAYPS